MMKLLPALALLCALDVHARQPTLVDELTRTFQSRTDKAPATAQIETGYSPEGSAERLVLKVIHASRKSIRLAAYSFTSPRVVRALTEAHKRGVDVRVVADEKGTASKSGTAALNLLVNAGIPVRTNDKYAIHHDKFIVSDGLHVQTGSFNYSQAAANANSENVIVVWHNAELAASYLWHWSSRFDEGRDVRPRY